VEIRKGWGYVGCGRVATHSLLLRPIGPDHLRSPRKAAKDIRMRTPQPRAHVRHRRGHCATMRGHCGHCATHDGRVHAIAAATRRSAMDTGMGIPLTRQRKAAPPLAAERIDGQPPTIVIACCRAPCAIGRAFLEEMGSGQEGTRRDRREGGG
jgi:hypothetical protein